MKRYYITWTEKKYGRQETYRTWVTVQDRREAKDLILIEQNYRRWNGLPHMFHVEIGLHGSNVTWIAKTLYISKEDCNQEMVLEIKNKLFWQGAIR